MCKTCCNNHKKKEAQPELAVLQTGGATVQQEDGRNLDGVDNKEACVLQVATCRQHGIQLSTNQLRMLIMIWFH